MAELDPAVKAAVQRLKEAQGGTAAQLLRALADEALRSSGDKRQRELVARVISFTLWDLECPKGSPLAALLTGRGGDEVTAAAAAKQLAPRARGLRAHAGELTQALKQGTPAGSEAILSAAVALQVAAAAEKEQHQLLLNTLWTDFLGEPQDEPAPAGAAGEQPDGGGGMKGMPALDEHPTAPAGRDPGVGEAAQRRVRSGAPASPAKVGAGPSGSGGGGGPSGSAAGAGSGAGPSGSGGGGGGGGPGLSGLGQASPREALPADVDREAYLEVTKMLRDGGRRGQVGRRAGPASAATAPDLASLVAQVRECLPDCPEDAVTACLEDSGYDPERAVLVLLEQGAAGPSGSGPAPGPIQ